MDSIFDSAFVTTAIPPAASSSAAAAAALGAAAAAAPSTGSSRLPQAPSPAPYWLHQDGTRIYTTPRGHDGSYSKPSAAAAAPSPSFIILDDVEFCPHQATPLQGPTSALDCPADISLLWPPALEEGKAAVVDVRASLQHRQLYACRPRKMKISALQGDHIITAAVVDVAHDGSMAARLALPPQASGVITVVISSAKGCAALASLKRSAPLLVLPAAAVPEFQALHATMMGECAATALAEANPDADLADLATDVAVPEISFDQALVSMDDVAAGLAMSAWCDHYVPLMSDLSFVMGYSPASAEKVAAAATAAAATSELAGMGNFLSTGEDDGHEQPAAAGAAAAVVPEPSGVAAGAMAVLADAAADVAVVAAADLEDLGAEVDGNTDADLDSAAYQAVMAGVLQFMHANDMWHSMSFLLRFCASNGISFTNGGEELASSDMNCQQVCAIAAEADAAGAQMAAAAAEAGADLLGGEVELLFSHSTVDENTIIVSAVRASPGVTLGRGGARRLVGQSPVAGDLASVPRTPECQGGFDMVRSRAAVRQVAVAQAAGSSSPCVAAGGKVVAAGPGQQVLLALLMVLVALLGVAAAGGL